MRKVEWRGLVSTARLDSDSAFVELISFRTNWCLRETKITLSATTHRESRFVFADFMCLSHNIS